jgi:hypothetical protein
LLACPCRWWLRWPSVHHECIMPHKPRTFALLLVTAHMTWLVFHGWTDADKWLFWADAAIVVLIVKDDLWRLGRYWLIRHRSRRLLERLLLGQELQDRSSDENWISDVDRWVAETENLVRQYSVQAAASFSHSHRGRVTPEYARKDSGRYNSILYERLTNLRNILERPEVYL